MLILFLCLGKNNIYFTDYQSIQNNIQKQSVLYICATCKEKNR